MKLRGILAAVLALGCTPALGQVNPGTAPLSIAKGGTAAATASAAFANLVQPPSATTLGGVKSLTCASSNWFNTLSTLGVFGCAQPNFTDLAGSLALAQIPANLITYAKIQTVTAARLLGNPTGGAASPSEISLGATLAFSGSALQTNALTGDVTTSANAFATTIAANAVTNAKMATMAAGTVKANATGGSAVPTDVAPAAARSSSLLNIDQLTGHGDSIYTILATDRTVGTNAAFTASRTWTLPAANAVNAGQEIIVADFQGTVTPTNTLVISRAGADTVNGGTSVTMTSANGAYLFKSDGTSKWTAQALGSAAGGGVSSVTCNGGLTGGVITTSGTCAADFASKSDMQTATSTTKVVNVRDVQDHPAVGKVVVGFNGLNASCPAGACVSYHNFNASSLLRNGTGDYTVTFGTACTTATYAWFISSSTPGTTIGGFFAVVTIAAGSFRFTTRDTANALTDFSFVNLEIFCTH